MTLSDSIRSLASARDGVIALAVEQLARRGIVLRSGTIGVRYFTPPMDS